MYSGGAWPPNKVKGGHRIMGLVSTEAARVAERRRARSVCVLWWTRRWCGTGTGM